jgi:hypothetical protein
MPTRIPIETADSNTMLNYYAMISYTQKPNLKRKGGQFIYTSTPLSPLHKGYIVTCECRAGTAHRYRDW